MLELRSVSEEVRELTDDEELAEHIEQLVWNRLYYFDEKLAELDSQLAEAREQAVSLNLLLPFLTGFGLGCLGCLVIFWGC